MKISLLLCIGLLFSVAQARVTASKDLADIQAACADPASVGNQNPPSEINVTCTGSQQTWQVAYSTPVDLAQSATATSSATTDKDGVGADETSNGVALETLSVGCPTYTKVDGSATGNFMVTCEEVAGMTNLNLWCATKLVEEATANPALWTGTTAGEVYEPCTDPAGPVGGPEGDVYPVTLPVFPGDVIDNTLPDEGTPTTPPDEGTATVR